MYVFIQSWQQPTEVCSILVLQVRKLAELTQHLYLKYRLAIHILRKQDIPNGHQKTIFQFGN